MTITFTGAGTAVSATGASSQVVTTTTAFAVGDYIVAFMAYDNTGGGGADPVSGVTSMAVSAGSVVGGSTMTGINDPSTASSGLAARADIRKVTGAIASGSTVTVSWSGTVTIRSVVLMKVSTNVSGATLNARINSGNGSTMTNTVGAATATLVTPSATAGEGVLCYAGHENGAAFTGDADTTNGTWSAVYGAFQGSGLTGMAAYFQAKVVTATATQSWDITGTSSDWIQGATIFTETAPPPSITQQDFCFYAEGTESGSTAPVGQGFVYNPDLTAGDVSMHLRFLLQATTANAVPASDWQLQYEKNSVGGWINVTTGTTNAAAYNSANLTEGQATTNRLTGGTGTFEAGKVSEDGTVDTVGWAGSNFTELLYAVTLKSANLVNADSMRFRVVKNGATTDMTYTTPGTALAQVVKLSVAQHGYQFYADGTETGATSLAAADTAISSDVTLAAALVQLRTRLQTTSSVSAPATDDWQLQYEKNASGTWVNVDPNPTGYVKAASGGSALNTQYAGFGMPFYGNGQKLIQSSVYLKRTGTLGFNVIAEVYAHSGVFGSSSVPTGAALASVTLPASTAPTTFGWVDFTFDGTLTLVKGTPYVATLRVSTPGSTGIDFALDLGLGGLTGNVPVLLVSNGTWTYFSDAGASIRVLTTPPEVYAYDSASLTDGAATTNRLSTGSFGSFVAGKVSEDGLVDNVGWSGNNYTELLYTIGMAMTLANATTLRFRILRNGVTTFMIYSVTPTISIIAPAGGLIKVWSGSAWVDKPVKVWTGAAWVQKPVKVWSGSAWVLS
jgi:hypothetical protein